MKNKNWMYLLARACIMVSLLVTMAMVSWADDLYSGGDGSQLNPYLISNADDLKDLSGHVDDSNYMYYEVTGDIVINEGTFDEDGICTLGDGSVGIPDLWVPIGSTGEMFRGSFDGKGYTISGMYVDYNRDAGLFGVVYNSTIRNVTIDRSFIKGLGSVGSLVGEVSSESIFIDCNTTSDVIVKSNYRAGGLIGEVIYRSKIFNCHNGGIVISDNISGGVVGDAFGTTMIGCSSSGSVRGVKNVGGLGGMGTDMYIVNSFNTGSVTATELYGGGLIGEATNLTMLNSYNLGDIVAGTCVGGLVGKFVDGMASHIENCYSAGSISVTETPSQAGVFIGMGEESDQLDMTNNYWDNEMMLVDTSTVPVGNVGKTTSDLQTNLFVELLNTNRAAMNPTSIMKIIGEWKHEDGSYPQLKAYKVLCYEENSGVWLVPEPHIMLLSTDTVESHPGPSPTKFAFDFQGWYTDIEGGNKVEVGTVLNEGTMLYSQWKPKIESNATIKGVVVTDVGEPRESQTVIHEGFLTISSEAAADTTGVGAFVTDFASSDSSVDTKVVKYKWPESIGDFDAALAYNDEEISTGDILTVRIMDKTSDDFYYYKIKVYVEPKLSISSCEFNKSRGDEKYTDIILNKYDNGNRFFSIYNGDYRLIRNTDYTISGDVLTLNKSYIETLAVSSVTLGFQYNYVEDLELVVNISKNSPEATPTGDFDYDTMELKNVNIGMEYSIDGGVTWFDLTEDHVTLSGVTDVNGIQVCKPGDGATTEDSCIQIIGITKANTLDLSDFTITQSTVVGGKGKVSGLTNEMAYSVDKGLSWWIGSVSSVEVPEGTNFLVKKSGLGTSLEGDVLIIPFNIYVAPSTSSGHSHHSSDKDKEKDEEIVIKENETPSTMVETRLINGTEIMVVGVEEEALKELLKEEGNKKTLTIASKEKLQAIVGALNGQTIKNMEEKDAILAIETGSVAYKLPASEINIDDIAKQLGKDIQLKDINIDISITESSGEMAQLFETTVKEKKNKMMVKPVEFKITCTLGDQTVDVSKFNGYVERIIEIPNTEALSQMTTGVVIAEDGSYAHVPTFIYKADGKYYAKINSLTNSSYSVIYNKVEFEDVENHWARDTINELGSRLIVMTNDENKYKPDESISQSDFVAMIVRALGLTAKNKAISPDHMEANESSEEVKLAYLYDIIGGDNKQKFEAEKNMTREEAMHTIYRASKQMNIPEALFEGDLSRMFEDYGMQDPESDEAVTFNLQHEIIKGDHGKINLKSELTKAEAATIILRLLQKSELIDMRSRL